jgi:YaiO family outer membrane protein
MTISCRILIFTSTIFWLLFTSSQSIAGEAQTPYQVTRATDKSEEIRLLRSHLSEQPEDVPARARLARLLGQSRRYDEALKEYESLIEDYPQDVDYSLGRAQVLSWRGNTGEALEELERAKQLAPDYEAIWQLQFSLLARQHTADSQATLDTLRPDAQARFPGAQWHTSNALPDEFRWELTLGAAYDQLSGDNQDWNNQFLHVDWRQSPGARYFGHIARDARYDLSDTGYAVGGEWKLNEQWTVGSEVNASPGADFQAESGFAAHVEKALGNAWIVDAGMRQRRYSSATVSTYIGTVQKYFGNYRAAYGFNLSHLHGSSNTVAHTLALDWYINAQSSMRITVAGGEEAEAVAPGQVLQTSVSSVTLSGRHAVNQRLTLSWWAGTHRQGDLYRRTYAGLAFTVGL